MATPRGGKPYIWVTWLAKQLGGDSCLWSAWFKAHYKYEKFESPEDLTKLQEWNRNHQRLMRDVRDELVDHGWTCRVEAENEFNLEGQAATVAGKADLIATMPGHVLIVDGKTGQVRESDWWQVAIYLYAARLTRPDLKGDVAGEIRYLHHHARTIRAREVSDKRVDDMVQMIKRIAAAQAPPRAPSRGECQRCNIGPGDCPERFRPDRAPATTAAMRF